MALPRITAPTQEIELSDGSVVTIRSLTGTEAWGLRESAEDNWETIVGLLTHGTDTPEAEVREWVGAAPIGDVNTLAEAITALSKMEDKPSPNPDGASSEG